MFLKCTFLMQLFFPTFKARHRTNFSFRCSVSSNVFLSHALSFLPQDTTCESLSLSFPPLGADAPFLNLYSAMCRLSLGRLRAPSGRIVDGAPETGHFKFSGVCSHEMVQSNIPFAVSQWPDCTRKPPIYIKQDSHN